MHLEIVGESGISDNQTGWCTSFMDSGFSMPLPLTE